MSRRSRSSRSGRRGTTRPAYGGGFYGADLASVQMLTPGDFPAMLARFTPRPSACTTCLGPIRRLDLVEFAAAWARVTDQGPDAAVLDDLQSDSLWWCDGCDRGGAAFLADGEEVAMGVGASCSCCA